MYERYWILIDDDQIRSQTEHLHFNLTSRLQFWQMKDRRQSEDEPSDYRYWETVLHVT